MKENDESEILGNIFFCPGGTPSSKNGKMWTGKRFLSSKATMTWRKESEQWWKDNKEDFKEQLENLEKPYLIGMHFVRKSKHAFDEINPMQTIQDEAVKYDYLDDDNTNEMMPFPLNIDGNWHSYDKEKPGVYIKIFTDPEEIKNLNEILSINNNK